MLDSIKESFTESIQIQIAAAEALPDAITHAAQAMVAQSWESPEDWYMTNVVSQVKLHDRIRKLPFVNFFLVAFSSL